MADATWYDGGKETDTEDITKNIYAITSSHDENKPVVNVCKKNLPQTSWICSSENKDSDQHCQKKNKGVKLV